MSARRVGRYRLEEVIGVGSFATVHRATDERLDATVVVKLLAENHSLNPEIRERFIAEGRALRRVHSRHVVTVHDIGETERQQPYLVLEHADRGTLAARVALLREQGWAASREDVLTVAEQLGSALQAVHSAQLVHRDLSPANVLIATDPERSRRSSSEAHTTGQSVAPEPHGAPTRLLAPDERLVVADLGMCKDLALNSGLTVAGGTAGYRPPEMDSGPAVIDTRADLWSLSALVRWLVEDAELPGEVMEVLDQGQATDPEDRQPDVDAWTGQMALALSPPRESPAQQSGDVTSGETADGTNQGTPTDERARSRADGREDRGGRWWALVAAALVLGLLTGWLLRGDGTAPEATGTARIEVEGPEQATVGEPTTLTLRHLGVESWVWVLPTGQHVADAETVTLTPSGPGEATVVVLSQDDEGRDLRTEHDLTVQE